MEREDFYYEMKQGMVNRFQSLTESEQNIIRQNIDSEFSKVATQKHWKSQQNMNPTWVLQRKWDSYFC